MKPLHKTSFLESLQIQGRVIYALLMREIITRYGRNNLGFLWLFVEPLMMTALIVVLWGAVRGEQTAMFDIMAFMLTGYPLVMMWRNASNRAIGSVNANIALLYHRNVRVLDTIFTRMLLEVAGATIAQIVLIFLLVVMGWISPPDDIPYMLMAWLLMAMFAMGLGFIVCAIAHYVEFFGKLWGTLSFLMLPLSGAFFFVHSFPPTIREYLLWIPMIHGTEMFRAGYFGSAQITHENPWYLLSWNLVLLWLGLLAVAKFSKGVEPQ